MNILTTNGIVGRYLSDWAGSSWHIKRIALKLGAPNFPGDTMTLSDDVVALDQDQQPPEITIDFKGKNGMGNHVTGTAYLIAKGAA